MGKEMIQRIRKSLLFSLPVFLGFIALAISLSFGLFIMGLSGVIVVVRKEMPSGRGTARGLVAVVTGTLFTMIAWGMTIYFF
jgi:hypothetical protein